MQRGALDPHNPLVRQLQLDEVADIERGVIVEHRKRHHLLEIPKGLQLDVVRIDMQIADLRRLALHLGNPAQFVGGDLAQNHVRGHRRTLLDPGAQDVHLRFIEFLPARRHDVRVVVRQRDAHEQLARIRIAGHKRLGVITALEHGLARVHHEAALVIAGKVTGDTILLENRLHIPVKIYLLLLGTRRHQGAGQKQHR